MSTDKLMDAGMADFMDLHGSVTGIRRSFARSMHGGYFSLLNVVKSGYTELPAKRMNSPSDNRVNRTR